MTSIKDLFASGINRVFAGKVMRKDLVRKVKVGPNISGLNRSERAQGYSDHEEQAEAANNDSDSPTRDGQPAGDGPSPHDLAIPC